MEVDAEVMKVDKVVELFQTMAIVSLNMGNLILEVNILNNILIKWEKKRRQCYKRNWIRRYFQKRYKHNVEIWRKNRAKIEQKIKTFIKNL
jgi:hypothetical protein